MSNVRQIIRTGTEFCILTTKKDGKLDAEKLVAEAAVSRGAFAKSLETVVRTHGAIRNAMLSFLGAALKDPRMDGFRLKEGETPDPTGKVSAVAKEGMRDAEKNLVRALVEEGILKLKNEDAILSYVLALRDDKNFQGCRTVVLKYFTVCGKYPVTDDGFLVPVKVMQTEIADALPDATPEDTSVFARLLTIISEVHESKTMTADEYKRVIDLAGNLLMTAKDGRDACAERATLLASGTAAAVAGQAAIDNAMAKVGEAIL
jgi:hypothetical protein